MAKRTETADLLREYREQINALEQEIEKARKETMQIKSTETKQAMKTYERRDRTNGEGVQRKYTPGQSVEVHSSGAWFQDAQILIGS